MQYSKVEDTHFPQNSLIRVKEKLLDLRTPKVMGILNITSDSFHAASRIKSDKQLIESALKHINEGADFLDIGAQSSRPGAKEIPLNEEVKKIESAVQLIKQEFPTTFISVDTYRSDVARAALENGCDIINDISAGNLDENMMKTVAQYDAPYIMMHMKGTPENMASQTEYGNVMMDLILYFSQKIEEAKSAGIKDIIIDPGFGFSKTLEQNYEILNNLSQLTILERPILLGLSRKSMIYNKLKIKSSEALNGTTVLNTLGILRGGNILRVHDVREAKEIIQLID